MGRELRAVGTRGAGETLKGDQVPKKRQPPKRRGRNTPPPPKARPRGKLFPKGNSFGAATRFKPGQTGNAGGVPKSVQEFRERVRLRTERILDRYDDVIEHGSEQGILKAGDTLLAHGWGRPSQPHEHAGAGGGPIVHTFADVRRKLADLAAGGVTGDGDADDDPDDPGTDTG